VSRHEKLLLVTISDLIVETRSTNLNSLHRHLVYSILDTALWHTFKIFLKQKRQITLKGVEGKCKDIGGGEGGIDMGGGSSGSWWPGARGAWGPRWVQGAHDGAEGPR
jgi:hypothetical protein